MRGLTIPQVLLIGADEVIVKLFERLFPVGEIGRCGSWTAERQSSNCPAALALETVVDATPSTKLRSR
jgi:hypothetical protein